MEQFIVNRDGNKLCVRVENEGIGKPMAFVMHGLGGNMDQPHIRAMAEAFLENGYTVVSWDAVHTFGKSEGGLYEDATVTNYYADMEDVIDWARLQAWFREPFLLCGHSLGGICTALYAEKHPDKVKALAPISAVISGKLSLETDADDYEAWQREGIRVTTSYDGKREKRLKWSHMEDRLKYDLLPEANKLNMPVFLAVGERDNVTPLKHQQLFYNLLPGKKQLYVIEGAEHSFRELQEQNELKKLLSAWLQNV